MYRNWYRYRHNISRSEVCSCTQYEKTLQAIYIRTRQRDDPGALVHPEQQWRLWRLPHTFGLQRQSMSQQLSHRQNHRLYSFPLRPLKKNAYALQPSTVKYSGLNYFLFKCKNVGLGVDYFSAFSFNFCSYGRDYNWSASPNIIIIIVITCSMTAAFDK